VARQSIRRRTRGSTNGGRGVPRRRRAGRHGTVCSATASRRAPVLRAPKRLEPGECAPGSGLSESWAPAADVMWGAEALQPQAWGPSKRFPASTVCQLIDSFARDRGISPPVGQARVTQGTHRIRLFPGCSPARSAWLRWNVGLATFLRSVFRKRGARRFRERWSDAMPAWRTWENAA